MHSFRSRLLTCQSDSTSTSKPSAAETTLQPLNASYSPASCCPAGLLLAALARTTLTFGAPDAGVEQHTAAVLCCSCIAPVCGVGGVGQRACLGLGRLLSSFTEEFSVVHAEHAHMQLRNCAQINGSPVVTALISSPKNLTIQPAQLVALLQKTLARFCSLNYSQHFSTTGIPKQQQ